MEPFEAHPVRIGAFCDKNPTLPESMQPKPAETSRLLDGLEKRHKDSKEQIANALSFKGYRMEADGIV